MDKYMWGKSQAAINLITTLNTPEYSDHARRVRKILHTQLRAMESIMDIKDTHFKRATLELWHHQFSGKLIDLPEVIRTHVLCVETGKFRELILMTG